MLLRKTGPGVIAISQPAHAWLSGLMAAAWGNPRFAAPEPRQEVCLAAGLHDIGWLDWEADPEFDPRTGWPRVFADVPAEHHTQLWLRGVRHVEVYGRYAAILVSMHGDTIYDKTFDAATARPQASDAVRRFRAEGVRFREGAVAAVRNDPALSAFASDAQFAFNKRLLAAVDTLSLQLGWNVDEAAIDDVPLSPTETTSLTLSRTGEGRFSLDPWPFAGSALALHLQGRVLPHAFDNAAAMRLALDGATTTTLEITLVPR